jgi:hypothetical protein
MIVYDLVCARQHRFEGWFGSAEDFTRQRDDALIRCPMCDDAAIQRRPSANIQVGRTAEIAVATNDATTDKKPEAASTGQSAQVVAPDARTLALLRKLVAETENVGRAFPEEARKIHYEEAPKRGIRGQATSEEADALREEGIDFMSLPGILTRDLN